MVLEIHDPAFKKKTIFEKETKAFCFYFPGFSFKANFAVYKENNLKKFLS